jgi:cytochrome c oxidase subunit 2
VGNGLGDTRKEYTDLLHIYWPIGVAVFVIVVAAVVFAVVRYRSDGDEYPRGRDSNKVLEAGYALFLACVVAVLLYFTYDTMNKTQASSPRAAELVKVTGARWNWRFEYPRHGIVRQGTNKRPPTLFVPAGTPIQFRGTALDVIHSFWIPDERFKRDVFPRRTTTWVMRFDRTGFHREGGECAEFCGLLHTTMDFNVDVLRPAEFSRWVRDARAEAAR